MHRTSVKCSAPDVETLLLIQDLADDSSYVWINEVDLTIEFTFEFPDKPDYLLEQTMDRFNIVALEEDPRFDGCELLSVKEYPCEA